MTQVFASVVTPVYNNDRYLEQCIKSVLGQSHGDFEYIISNNHSTDRSGEIAKDFAARDPRIRVVSPPKFVTAIPNFNFVLGLTSPRAKYCKMVLSDDWIYPQCLTEMIGVAERHPTIGLVSSYRVVEDAPQCFGLPVDREFFSGRDAARAHFFGKAYPFGSQSTVLYRSDLVRARAPRFFDEAQHNCDQDAALRILAQHDFGFVHQVLSFSRYQPGSAMEKMSAFSPWFLAQVQAVAGHGKNFLDSAEYERCWQKVSREYYRELGGRWIKDRLSRRSSEDFWSFQRQSLAAVGETIEPRLLAAGVRDSLVRKLGRPGEIPAQLSGLLARPS